MENNIDKDISYFRNKIKVNTGIVKEARKNGDINAEQLVADLDEESKRLENILNFIDLSKEVETHIPKGIEILKSFNAGDEYTEKIKQAIENALDYIDRTEHTRKLACGFKKMYDKKSLELEKYKKIAEILTNKLLDLDCEGSFDKIICSHIPNEICEKMGDDNCDKCVIDMARREAENYE